MRVQACNAAHRCAGLLLAAAVLIAGCTTTTSEYAPGEESSGRPPVRNAGECDFDLTDAKAETVFYTLGFLNDYNGRQIVEEGEQVEHLYCNEANLAEDFRAVLTRLSAEQNLPVPEEHRGQECLTLFSSAELAARLNSCYQYELNDSMTAPAPKGPIRRRIASGKFNFGLLHAEGGVDHARARAYLTGAWRRWGRDGMFVFANAGEKAEGIAFVLSELGCSSVSVEHTVGMIPGSWRVKFTPTDEVAEWLSMKPSGR